MLKYDLHDLWLHIGMNSNRHKQKKDVVQYFGVICDTRVLSAGYSTGYSIWNPQRADWKKNIDFLLPQIITGRPLWTQNTPRMLFKVKKVWTTSDDFEDYPACWCKYLMHIYWFHFWPFSCFVARAFEDYTIWAPSVKNAFKMLLR